MNRSISVVISALNEEKNIQASIETMIDILERQKFDYEILVFNDGSVDRTGEIAENLAKRFPRIKVIHNSPNQGLAHIARTAFQIATKEYLTWFPGDNSIVKESMEHILAAIVQAEVIVGYLSNTKDRPLIRRILSKSFALTLNTLFDLNLYHYTGTFVYPIALLRTVPTKATGYDFFAELLIRSLKRGVSYKQVPFLHKTDNEKSSKAFSRRNATSTFRTIFMLITEINFKT